MEASSGRDPFPEEINDIDDPDLREAVKDKWHEQKAEDIVATLIAQDPERFGLRVQQKADSERIDAHARALAAREEREARGRQAEAETNNVPWGISYLNNSSSLEDIRTEAAKTAENVEEAREHAIRRNQILEREAAKARQETLRLGRKMAADLRAAEVKPDIGVFTAEFKKVRKWFSTYATHNKMSAEVDVTEFPEQPTYSGWLLPISGQTDSHATLILQENGKILVGFGRLKRKGNVLVDQKTKKETAVDRLEVYPNQAEDFIEPKGVFPIFNRKDAVKHIRKKTYTSELENEFETDIAASILPTLKRSEDLAFSNVALSRARVKFAREEALQNALASLQGKIQAKNSHGVDPENEEVETQEIQTK